MRDLARSAALWLRTAFRAAPLLVSLQCALQVTQSVLAPTQAYGVALLVVGVLQGHSLVPGTVLVVAAFAVNFLIEAVFEPLSSTTYERIHCHLHEDLLRLTGSIEGIEHHELPEVANRLQQLGEETWRLSRSARTLVAAAGTVAGTLTVLYLLASVHPVLLGLPLLGLLRVWAATASGRRLWQAVEETTADRRQAERLLEIAGNPRYGVEVRSFGLRPVLLQRIRELLHRISTAESAAGRRGALLEGGASAVFGLAYVAAVVFVVLRVRQGDLHPGDVALIVLLAGQVDQAASGLASSARELGQLLAMFGGYVWLREYAAGAVRPAPTAELPERAADRLTLERVGFRYQGSERDVLADIDLTIPGGTVVALVGDNGAGKTTLVKLLLRLYDPTFGAIRVDGSDLRAIASTSWWAASSVGFQDFCRFEFTTRETIGVGDLAHLTDDDAVHAAVRHGDATTVVERLPAGLDTQLGKHFADGVELSGGQWQRLALSRAFMRPRPHLLVLDEPTAALDPDSEHALYARFAAASRETTRTGGISVLVSHRFSTVQMADVIVVLSAGRIVEAGSHSELMALGGQYAELFDLQARAYR